MTFDFIGAMNVNFIRAVSVGLAGALLLAGQVLAKDTPPEKKLFGAVYSSPKPVGPDQAQVIYYRSANGVQRDGAANVYVDREFHTGLLPQGFTQFCVQPGTHFLGAYLGDPPRYAGKTTDLYRAPLQSGNTYYLRVREQGGNFPESVSREVAERELSGARAQTHVLSRASAVESCRYYNFLEESPSRKEYVLPSDVLFAFNKSETRDISAAGRVAIKHLVEDLQRQDAQIKRVEVEGHTDPIGNEAANQNLGQKRADSVRQILAEYGLPQALMVTSSMGSRQPVKHSCYGSRDQQIACYAPNRRVIVRIDTNPKTNSYPDK